MSQKRNVDPNGVLMDIETIVTLPILSLFLAEDTTLAYLAKCHVKSRNCIVCSLRQAQMKCEPEDDLPE